MAASTSRAAASMLRFRSNCRVMLVCPSALDDVISVTEAIRPNCRSSGVATEEAMISGLAPGKRCRDRYGRKIDLRKRRNRKKPEGNSARQARLPTVSRVVAMGLFIKGDERLMV